MFIWNIKCHSEYFFWFCLFFDSKQEVKTNSLNRKWWKTIFIFGRRSACFKRIFGSLAETLQKAAVHLQESLEITFKHYKTFEVNLNMSDEAAHTCRKVTGSDRLCRNTTSKLSLKLWKEMGRDISHGDVQSVQTFLVSPVCLSGVECLSTDTQFLVVFAQVEVRCLQRRWRLHDDRWGQIRLLTVGWLLCSSIKGSFFNISRELQDPNCSTDWLQRQRLWWRSWVRFLDCSRS